MLYVILFIIGLFIGFMIACLLVAAKDERWRNRSNEEKTRKTRKIYIQHTKIFNKFRWRWWRMNYIIKYITKSKYFGHVRVNYKEVESYEEAYKFVTKNKIKSSDYDIYGKVIL